MKRSGEPASLLPTWLRWLIPLVSCVGVWILVILLSALAGFDLVLVLLPLLLVAMLIGALSGSLLGALSSVVFVLLVNWYLVPPVHTLRIESSETLVALLVFVLGSVVASVATNVVIAARAHAALTAAQRSLIVDVVDEVSSADAIARLQSSLQLTSVRMDRVGSHPREVPLLSCGEAKDAGSGELVFDVTVLESYRIRGYGPARMALDPGFLDSLAVAVARAFEGELLLEEQASNARLLDLDRARSALLASVGHDLRTPLSSMRLAAESLRTQYPLLSHEDRDSLLETMDSAGRRLDLLIENLLDVSRIESGALIAVSASGFLDVVVAQALLEVDSSRVTLVSPRESIPVQMDEVLLRRAVVNVVANAVIHDGSSAPIVVEIREDTGWLEVRVIDHGRGIPAGKRAESLRPFSQVGTRADGGSGAGLFIAEAFMASMGGALSLLDTPGGGLTVVMSLPTPATS